MNSIILSIKPLFVEAIINGKKTIELRRRVGSLFEENARIFIYATSPVKSIVAEAKILCVRKIPPLEISKIDLENACVSQEQFDRYFMHSSHANLIHLKDVKTLKDPICLFKLRQLNITPPQSFCYTRENIFLAG